METKEFLIQHEEQTKQLMLKDIETALKQEAIEAVNRGEPLKIFTKTGKLDCTIDQLMHFLKAKLLNEQF